MFADERRAKIAEMIGRNHSVTTGELTALFQVSLETVRKDLESMEKQGLLKRVHGGAVTVRQMQSYRNLAVRSGARQPEKHAVALAACSHICEGDFIALDTGSTAIELAKILAGRFDSLTVLTNSLEIFHILSETKTNRIILTGGCFQPEEKSFYSHLTVDMIRQFHVKKYFLTPSGISLDFGISDHVCELIEVQRAMLGISEEVYVLADSSKFESHAPLKICAAEPAYRYLTDSGLPEEIFRAYQKASLLIENTAGGALPAIDKR